MEDNKAGHRERVKRKYYDKGEGAFYDYELLEMLLFYSIPRRDTKDIAKELLKKFGSMDNLFHSDIQRITTVDGVGRETAILIKLVADMGKRALDEIEKQITIKGTGQAAEYFKRLLENEPREKFAAILFDNGNRVQYSGVISEGTFGMAAVSMQRLTQLISYHNATGVIIAHNHPKGPATASQADINTTLDIRDFLKKIGVKLVDHIIIGSHGIYSMSADTQCKNYFRQ